MSAEHRPDFPCGVRTRLREWPASTRPAPLAGAQGEGDTVPFPSASDAAEARFRRDLLAGIRDVAGSGLVTDPHDLAPLPEGSDAGEGRLCDRCGIACCGVQRPSDHGWDVRACTHTSLTHADCGGRWVPAPAVLPAHAKRRPRPVDPDPGQWATEDLTAELRARAARWKAVATRWRAVAEAEFDECDRRRQRIVDLEDALREIRGHVRAETGGLLDVYELPEAVRRALRD
jgi:hypothetical protein